MLLILKKSKVKGLQVRVYCCEKIPIKGTNLSRKLQEAVIVIKKKKSRKNFIHFYKANPKN